jgi:flagellar hook-associated protein 2
MTSVSSIGVGSGLPLSDLLTSLRNSENNALVAIQTQQASVQGRLSAYGQIQSSIQSLKAASDTLASTDTFGALTANVNGDGLTASADTTAISGQYSIRVESLATNQTLVTDGLVSRINSNGTGGVITLTMGDGTQKTLDLTGKSTSLSSLVSAINADPSLGASATIINDGSGTPYRLLLSSSKTGTDNSIASISVTGNDTLNGIIGFDQANPGATPNITETAASNAAITINGIAISSQTNTIADAIEGVTLTLSKADVGATNTLTVARDDSAATGAINTFVSAYNSLQSTVKSLMSYDTTTQKSSALTGDSLALRVQTQFRGVLNVVLSSGTVRSLSQLGITSDPTTGALSVNSDKLAAALKNNLSDVQSLFTGDNSVTQKLTTVANSYLGSTGYINAATTGANSTIVDLQKQYDATSASIDAKMATYTAQFTALDTTVAQMNSVSTYLTQQLSMLGNISSGK